MAYLTTDLSELLTSEQLGALNSANIWTVNDLFPRDLAYLRRSTNVSLTTLKDIYQKVDQRYRLPCNELNFLLDKSIRECKMCPTGLPELTQALDGGFQTQEIVEFLGDSEVGKTELCYLLCGEILSHYDEYQILYIASNFDLNHEKIAKYIKLKAGNRDLGDEDVYNALSRIDVARPTKLADLVHLLNTLVHSDKRNSVRCVIIDSLSFIIQEDILEIKTSNLSDADELEKFSGLKGRSLICSEAQHATIESARKDLIDIYLHEVMRLLTNIALIKNVMVILTNSDQNFTFCKSWVNAIDHRIHLTKMSEFSRFYLHNPRSTVRKATILKTIHNIGKIGYSIPFAISDEGLFAIRLASVPDDDVTSEPDAD